MDLLGKLKQEATDLTTALRPEWENICNTVFNFAELGSEEHRSCAFLAETMGKHGFKVTTPYCGLDTAFVAEAGEQDKPAIAFLAEYDALPGYGPNGEPGHACGHNWIAAATAGTSLVLSKLLPQFEGRVVLVGTPAEETVGNKVDMIKAGAFDHLDVCFQPHIGHMTSVDNPILAMDAIAFSFTGKASHAAASPEEGINALDAVMLTFAGMNALRQHLREDVRLHGIITHGGLAPNVVPEYACCRIHMRAKEREYLNTVVQKIKNCAEGAALMTGTQCSWEYFENPFDNMLNVPTLQAITKEALTANGVGPIISSGKSFGSSDIGNVSYKCPTMYIQIKLDTPEEVHVHEQSAMQYVNSSYAYDKLQQVIAAMSHMALTLYLQPETLKQVKEEHQQLLGK